MKTSVNRSSWRYTCIASAAALLIFAGCSLQGLAGGSGAETGNPVIVGTIVDSSGSPVRGVVASAIPAQYNPGADGNDVKIVSAVTGGAGNFSITVMTKGLYNIQAVSPEDRTRVLIPGIYASADTAFTSTGMLRKPGSLRVRLPDSLDVDGYVYIAGTTILARAQNGYATLDSVPAGLVPSVRYTNPLDSSRDHVILENVTVVPGGTAAIMDYYAWKYSKRIYFNTTATGAGVNGTVTDFPVLIRLTEANITFSQAAADGRDIRFTKPDNTPLAYEIERWDGTAQSAEIWVLVDTVYGNNQTQYIHMFWGNSDAPALSTNTTVFDTAKGFQGVWHLNEAGNAPAGDATANHYNGTPYKMDAAAAKPGTIGLCREFSGDSSCFIMQGTANSKLNFPEDGHYTISAWAYTDTVDSTEYTIAAKGFNQYHLVQAVYDRWEFSEYKDRTGWEKVHGVMAAREWTHLAGVRSGTREYLFVNGNCVDSVTNVWVPPDSMTYARYTGFDFMVGRTASMDWPTKRNFFKGKIDELRACDVARGADWVKLCFMNQRVDDKLVEVR